MTSKIFPDTAFATGFADTWVTDRHSTTTGTGVVNSTCKIFPDTAFATGFADTWVTDGHFSFVG